MSYEDSTHDGGPILPPLSGPDKLIAKTFLLSVIVSLSAMYVFGCGKVATVGVDVSGTVAVPAALTVTVSPASFVPFFSAQCTTLTQGQTCYNSDSTVCASCLSQMLYNDLGLPQPAPSPSP